RSPPTRPTHRHGTGNSPISCSKCRSASAGTDTTARDGPSPNRTSGSGPPPGNSTSAPTADAPATQLSASATATPPPPRPSRPRQPTPGGVVRRPPPPRAGRRPTRFLDGALDIEVERREPSGDPAVKRPEVLGAAEAHRVGTEQRDPAALGLEPLRAPTLDVI